MCAGLNVDRLDETGKLPGRAVGPWGWPELRALVCLFSEDSEIVEIVLAKNPGKDILLGFIWCSFYVHSKGRIKERSNNILRMC